MILVSVIHSDNLDTPNTGTNLHLTNQIGQEDFKLGGGLVFRNTDTVDFKATLNIKQCLLGVADDIEVSSITKDVPVTIPAGKGLELTAPMVGSIPMQRVDTVGKNYRYRLTVKNGDSIIADTVTGIALDTTNTVFTSNTSPFVAGNANSSIAAEILKNDAELATLPVEISTKQARLAKLTARNAALKSAIPL